MKNSVENAKGTCFKIPALVATLLLWGVGIATADAAGPVTRQIPSAGTVTLRSTGPGIDGVQSPELDPGLAAFDIADGPSVQSNAAKSAVALSPALSSRMGRMTNRSFARAKGFGESEDSHEMQRGRPELALSFDGLNFRQQRLANGGNQFSIEPPDQGLCVGNGFVLETVNDVLRVFDTSGNALTDPIALNSFYGYIPAIVRPSTFGPSITDPSCYFDRQTQRWFHVVLTLDRVGTTSGLSGTNHLDLAVSTTPSPLGPWNIYRIPVQDDGSQGTPVHANCPCLGDYPHIGADAHGFYITTNEFPFSGGFNSAQVYAISKQALAQGAVSIAVVQIDTIDHLLDGNPGFTVWPAISPAGEFERDNRGTEYFLSSLAVFNDNGTDSRLRLWALTNTRSLNSPFPNLFFTNNTVNVRSYGVPPLSNQKDGNLPLRDCINDTTLATPFGPGCWQFFFVAEPPHNEVISPLDSNDSRMQQVVFADGKLYGALDTVVNVRGTEQAGAAFYIIKPEVEHGTVTGKVKKQGKVAVFNNNVTYPAIAATADGDAIMSFTLVGADHFPSAAYVTIDEDSGAGPIRVAAEGVGPQDGFSGYNAFNAPAPTRPRWGDYGAAVSDGNSIWMAAEYINQTCTFAQYVTGALGSCGGTRASLGNWSTRISKVTP